MASSSGKKTRGRQKIEMKKIENVEDRLVTFSKRRSGVCKKLCEMSTLCGSDFLFICYSPTGKPFSFGHPSIESVANRFMNQNAPVNDNINAFVEAQRILRINALIQRYNQVHQQLDEAKQKEKELAHGTRRETNHKWWEAPIDQLNIRELEEIESRHAGFLNELYTAWNKRVADTSSMHAPMGPAQFTNAHIASSDSPMLAPIGPAQYNPFTGTSSMGPAQLTNSHIASSSMLAPIDPAQYNQFTDTSSMLAPMDHSQFNPFIPTSSMHAPIDPTQFGNPFTTNANEHAPVSFPRGEDHGPQQF